MIEVTFPELNDKVVAFDVDQSLADNNPPVFALGIRKCGSSIFYSMINALCIHSSIKFVDVAGRLFEEGVTIASANSNKNLVDLIQSGHLYGGFRNFPFYFENSDEFRQAKKVLLIRDPRDALVSEYFSSAHSHSMPKTTSTSEGYKEMELLRQRALSDHLEEYVMRRTPSMISTFMEFRKCLEDSNLKVFRYEEIIFNKKQLLRDVSSHLGLSYTEVLLDQIMGWADKRPTVEVPTEFVRKVTPGDWKEKLTDEFQDSLTTRLSEVLSVFGYPQ